MPELEAAPPVAPTTEVLVNPVLPADMEFSKTNFNEEMEKAGAVPPQTPVETPVAPEPKETPPPEKSEPEKATVPKKDGLQVPQELLDGKPAEKAADAAIAELDAMVLPKNAKPEQVASFSKLKESAKKAIEEKLARITELESKTHDQKPTAEIEAALARAEAAEKRATEIEETLNRTAFEKSPKFQAQFTDAETAAVEGAKSYLEGTEVNPGVIDVALRSPASKRLQILRDGGAEPELIAAITPYLATYDSLQRQKAVVLENYKAEAQNWQQEQTAQSEKAKAQRTAEEDRVWAQVISKAETDLLPYRRAESAPEWNNQGDDLKQKARTIFNGDGVPLSELADTIAKGVAYDVLNTSYKDLLEQLNAAKTQVEKLSSARPGAAELANGTQTEITPEMSADERAKLSFNQNLAAARGG